MAQICRIMSSNIRNYELYFSLKLKKMTFVAQKREYLSRIIKLNELQLFF
jgi:hypothetical protein